MPKISTFMAGLLITAALLADAIQALIDLLDLTGVGIIVDLIVNNGVNIVAVLAFYLWLKMLNVSFVDPKRALRFFGTWPIESIPIIGALPVWTGGIILTILSVWAEERIQAATGLNVALNSRLAAGSKKISGPGEAARYQGGGIRDLSKSVRDYREFKDKYRELIASGLTHEALRLDALDEQEKGRGIRNQNRIE